MKKIQLGAILTTTLLLASCGGNSKTPETTKTPTAPAETAKIVETPKPEAPKTPTTPAKPETKTSLFADKAELEKAYDELAKMPNLAGKDFNFFQHIHFYSDGQIKVAIQDPNNPENIDEYEYKKGAWLEPQPVQITGSGDMSANVKPLTKEIFTTASVVAENWKEKQKEVEGANAELTHMYLAVFGVGGSTLTWYAEEIKGTRAKYSIYFNTDGSVKEFKKM